MLSENTYLKYVNSFLDSKILLVYNCSIRTLLQEKKDYCITCVQNEKNVLLKWRTNKKVKQHQQTYEMLCFDKSNMVNHCVELY